MPHTTRMSYKAKWLAASSVDGTGDQAGRLQRCRRDVDAAMAEVRAMRRVHTGLAEKHMTLAGALQDAAAVCNEFLDIGVLSFNPVRTQINIESAADIVMAATAIVTQMADRFGLVCAGLEEIMGDGDTDGAVKELRTEVEALSVLMTRTTRPGRPRDLDTSRIAVAGKRLKFESLTPVDESPRWTLVPDADEVADTAHRGRTQQGKVGTGVPGTSTEAEPTPVQRTESASGPSAAERSVRAGSRPSPTPPGQPQSLWPSFEHRSDARTGSSPGARKGKERATLSKSRSRSSTPGSGVTSIARRSRPLAEGAPSRPGIDYRAEIALLDDVDWENVRASLSRTDQLTVRGLGPADLASLVIDDPQPRASHLRGASVTARLRSALRAVSAVKRSQRLA